MEKLEHMIFEEFKTSRKSWSMVSEILSKFTSDVGGWQLPGNWGEPGQRLFKAVETWEGFHSKVERNVPGISGIFNKEIQSRIQQWGYHCCTNESGEGCIPGLGSHGRKPVQEVFGSGLLSISTMQAVMSLPWVLHLCADLSGIFLRFFFFFFLMHPHICKISGGLCNTELLI